MVFPKALPQLLLFAAGLTLVVAVYGLWSRVLTNLYIPGSLAWSHPLAVPLALVLTGITILPYVLVAYRLRTAPIVLRVLIAVLVAVGSWMVYPVACDTRESFLDRPNRRYMCAGLSVHWYPRDVFDYSDVEY